jgi:sulfite exporter TauE/SafE
VNTELIALIGAVIAASVVGSLHCAGMCGAFVAMAVGLDRTGSRTRLHVAYNGGRLVTYTLIGAAAGALGAAFRLRRADAGPSAGCDHPRGGHHDHHRADRPRSLLRRQAAQGAGAESARTAVCPPSWARGENSRRRSGPPQIGLMTGLLPCGWLYAFALLAAGTSHPIAGAIVMAAFWLGTLPILISLGAGVRTLAGALGRHAPRAMSAVIVVLGVIAATDRGRTNVRRDGAAAPVDLKVVPDVGHPTALLHELSRNA